MRSNQKADPFIEAFLRERARLEDSVFRRVGCRATAADLVQDLFLRFWRRDVAVREATQAYLFRSARNIATDHLRSAAHRAEGGQLPLDLRDPQPAVDEALASRQQVDSIAAALDDLPERTRQAFLLSRIHGRSCPQIARALGVSVATIERDLTRAMDACRSVMNRP